MPNHYTNILIMWPGDEEAEGVPDDLETALAADWGDAPLQRVHPMPAHLEGTTSPSGCVSWYKWKIENWGTKWGIYQVERPQTMGGDCRAVQVVFQSAWGPPNKVSRDAIVSELRSRWGVERVVWIGLNPFDDTYAEVQQWD